MNLNSLRELVPPKGQTLKKIRNKFYLYQQTWQGGKITGQCLGPASEEQVRLHTDKTRIKLVKWIFQNEALFVDGLRLLAELREREQQNTQ